VIRCRFNNGEFNSSNFAVTWTNETDLTRAVRAQIGVEYLRQTAIRLRTTRVFSGQSQRYTRSVGSA